MSLMVLIECSHCYEGLTAAPTGKRAREHAREDGYHVNLPGGHDLCRSCWADGWRVVDGQVVRIKQRAKNEPDSLHIAPTREGT